MDFAQEAIAAVRSASFPVYAVRPTQWPGDLIVGGVWGSSTKPLAIRMRHDEDVRVERPRRRFVVVSTSERGLRDRPAHDNDLAWEFSYPDITQFARAFTQVPLRPVPGSERFNADLVDGRLVPKVVDHPSLGPRRVLPSRPFRDGAVVEPVLFDQYPLLRCSRVTLPSVEVLALGWGYDDSQFHLLVSRLRPVNQDAVSLRAVENAERLAWARIRERKNRGP